MPVEPAGVVEPARRRLGPDRATLTSTPTAAPIKVSRARPTPVTSAPAVQPTPSTSIALIGTSTRCGPSRRICPTMIEAATSAPRLHQVSPTNDTNSMASATPDTMLSTRCAPLTSVLAQRGLHDEQRRQRGG
jgi:hypothetical protein